MVEVARIPHEAIHFKTPLHLLGEGATADVYVGSVTLDNGTFAMAALKVFRGSKGISTMESQKIKQKAEAEVKVRLCHVVRVRQACVGVV
jgi:hypothetical protein